MNALLVMACGIVVGLPITLFGAMQLDERPGRRGWVILAVGLTATFAPVAVALALHQTTAGTGRYVGR